MFKYFVVFGIISLCYSMHTSLFRIPGIYQKLVLVQRSPVAVIFEQEYIFGNEGMAANRKAIKALREIGMSYQARSWIIEKLFATNGLDALTRCSFTRRPLRYHRRAFNATFTARLSKIWPSLDENLTDKKLWRQNYETYGCCVNADTLGYFENAMRLMENRNVGQILTGSGIHPGGTYELSRIMESIKNVSRTRPYVRCLPDQNSWSDEQYLLEVQMCFNEKGQFVDCDIRVNDLCELRKPIFYPGPPEH